MTVRTRFAPSPTGHLHIGGVRTALFSWLYARRHGGEFILRIEDTDRERSTQASIDAIVEGMQWLGLDHDEGPFFQTQRFDRYATVIEQLIDEDKAYHCYCSKQRLEDLRAEQMRLKQKPRYDGHCRDGAAVADVKPVVRFKNPPDGEVLVDDLLHGRSVFQNSELDDLIIARSDGTPTYNLTVVVDDLDMQITHVIRGDDHLNNTPRQVNILNALGASVPRYVHLPMICGSDGKRLSKRHGAVNVLQYRDDGYLPEAVLNYLVRLGWSHGDQEIFSMAELTRHFDLDALNKAAARFDVEKLLWLNQHYLKSRPLDRLAEELGNFLAQEGIEVTASPALTDVLTLQRERFKTLVDLARSCRYFYQEFSAYDPKAAAKNLKPAGLKSLTLLRERLAGLTDWSAEPIHATLTEVAERSGLKLGKIAQPLRVAVTGGSASPPIDITVELIGKDRSLARIDRALQHIRAVAQGDEP